MVFQYKIVNCPSAKLKRVFVLGCSFFCTASKGIVVVDGSCGERSGSE